MTDLATLYMSVDATGMAAGDQAMDRLAAKVETTETRVNSSLDAVAAKAKASMGRTPKSVTDAAKAMERTAPAAQKVGQNLDRATRQAKAAGEEIKSASGYTTNFNDIADMMAAGCVAQIHVNSVSCLIVLRCLHELFIQTPPQDQ